MYLYSLIDQKPVKPVRRKEGRERDKERKKEIDRNSKMYTFHLFAKTEKFSNKLYYLARTNNFYMEKQAISCTHRLKK